MTKITLSMHRVMSVRDGWVYDTGKTFKYRVDGLPAGEEASITESNGKWRISHVKDGVVSDWPENFESADEALAALQKEIDS